MKRRGHLFETAFTREALTVAFRDAAKSKRGKRACFAFEQNLGANLENLHTELHGGTYSPRPYFTFAVYSPKKRLIHAPAFRDCVVQHAIYRVISPIFHSVFIDQSFACRVGFGTHKAADYAQESLQKSPEESYTLQLDIRRFFYRINRDILKGLIEKKIKDHRFVDVMMAFTSHEAPLGIPIGNLLSQLYALVYLDPLDHYIKRVLEVRSYCRYVDDMVLFGLTKEQAISFRQKITSFIASNLNLELSRSTIAKTKRGVNFVGYRTWRSKRFIRRRSLYNHRQAVKSESLKSVVSILGHAKKTHSLAHLIRHTRRNSDALYNQLPESYRPTHHPHPARARAAG